MFLHIWELKIDQTLIAMEKKFSKIYFDEKKAFFLLRMATHLLAVAFRLSKFLPVMLTLAPSLERSSVTKK